MSALSARRWALIVAPVAVGTLTLVGVVAHLALASTEPCTATCS
jgi:hypothetical protein